MMYVLLHDGRTIEVPEADAAQIKGPQLILTDALGKLVQMFSTQDVSAYGKHEAMGLAARFDR
jgi:hypothetical protein